jgi:hypothetical protein
VKILVLVPVTLLLASCGYVGEPLPPLLHIPEAVKDLAAVQRGDQVLLQFTLPKLNSEGTAIRKAVRIELRGAPPPEGGFNADVWSSGALAIEAVAGADGRATAAAPAANWIGKQVIFGVRTVGESGRASAWSNLVELTIVPPLAAPSGVEVRAVAEGVRLSWSGSAPRYRILRREGPEEMPRQIATSDVAGYTDAGTEYGKTYRYLVQGVQPAGAGEAESAPSAEAVITPEDKFAPGVPTGLAAVAGNDGVELVWEPNTEADLAGYRVYRATGDGKLERLTGTITTPSYSDKKVETGKSYRYAVTSIDRLSNESAPCAAVGITAP